MHINHEFVLDFATQLCPKGRVLDYGCGAGEIVTEGLSRGVDIYGVERFYEGSYETRLAAEQTGLLGGRILELGAEGQIPFPDGHFGGVVANMVFEHVSDLGLVCREIRRVLRPEGFLLTLFPSKGVIREGHCGVPFTHRLVRWPRIASSVLQMGHAFGLGYFRAGKTRKQWADDFVIWIQNYCFYRSTREILSVLGTSGFDVRGLERRYVLYRLRGSSLLPLVRLLPLRLSMRLLVTNVLLCTPRTISSLNFSTAVGRSRY